MGTWIQEFHTQAQSWLSDLQALDSELSMEELLETSGPENKHLMAVVSALFKLIVSMATARRFLVKDILISDMATLEDISLDEGLKSKSFLPSLSSPKKPVQSTEPPQKTGPRAKNNLNKPKIIQTTMLETESGNTRNDHPVLRGMMAEKADSTVSILTNQKQDPAPASSVFKVVSTTEDSSSSQEVTQTSLASTNLLKMLSNQKITDVAPKLRPSLVTKPFEKGVRPKTKPKPGPRSPSPPSTALRSKFPLLAQTMISNAPRTTPPKTGSTLSEPKPICNFEAPLTVQRELIPPSPIKVSPEPEPRCSSYENTSPHEDPTHAITLPKTPTPASPPATTPQLCRSGRKAAQKANLMLAKSFVGGEEVEMELEESEDEWPKKKTRTPRKRKKTPAELTIPEHVLQFSTLQAMLSGPGPLVKRGRSTAKLPAFPQSTADALLQAMGGKKVSPKVPEPIISSLPSVNLSLVKDEVVDEGYKVTDRGIGVLRVKEEPMDNTYDSSINKVDTVVGSAETMEDKAAGHYRESAGLKPNLNPVISSVVGHVDIKQEPGDDNEIDRSEDMGLNMECESEDVVNTGSSFTNLKELPKKRIKKQTAHIQNKMVPKSKPPRHNINRRRKPVVTFAAHICFYNQCDSNGKAFESLEDLLDHWRVHFEVDEREVGYLQCWLNDDPESEKRCTYRAHLPQNKTSTRFFYHQGMSVVLDHMINTHHYTCPPYIMQFQGPCPVQGLNSPAMVAPGLKKSADNQRTSVLTMKRFLCFYAGCGQKDTDFQLLETYIEHWRDNHFVPDNMGQRSMKCWRCNFKTSLPKPPRPVTRFHYHLGITSLLQHLLKKHGKPCPDYVVNQECGVEHCGAVLLTIAQAEKHRAEHSEPMITCEHCGTAVKRRCLTMHLKSCHVKVSIDSGITWDPIIKKPKGRSNSNAEEKKTEILGEGGSKVDNRQPNESNVEESMENENGTIEETPNVLLNTSLEKRDKKALEDTASDEEESIPLDESLDDIPDRFEPGYTHRSMCVLHEFYCFLCRDGFDFGSLGSYIQHWRTKHTVAEEKSAYMPCKVCNKKYRMQRIKLSSQWHVHATMTRLLGHLIQKHNMPAPDFIEHIVCPEKGCGRKYFASYCLETHLRTHRIRTEHCPFCKTAVSYGKLPEHLAHCSTYGVSNTSKDGAQTSTANVLESSPFSLDDSNLSDIQAEPTDSDISDLEESGGQLEQLFGNAFGDSASTLESALPIPDNLHEGMARRRNASLCMFNKYVCFFCNREPVFPSDIDYFQHWKLNHIVYEEDKDFIPCKQCDKSFHVRRCNNLDNMYFVHHAITNYIRHTMKDHAEAPPECVARTVCMGRRSHRQICHKVFITREHFDNHQKQHLNINCNLCGKMIRATSQSMHYRFCKGLRRSNGQWNLYACEPSYNQYRCMLCPGVDIVYPDQDALTKHLLKEHVHQNEKDKHCISCPACDTVIPLQSTRDLESAVRVSLTNYIQHLYKKHELPPPSYVEPFRCPVGGCDYVAERVLLIAEHLKSHSETPEYSAEIHFE